MRRKDEKENPLALAALAFALGFIGSLAAIVARSLLQ